MRLSHLFNLGFYAMVDGFFRANYSESAVADAGAGSSCVSLAETAPSTTANLLAAGVMGGYLVYYEWNHMRKKERDMFVVASAERENDGDGDEKKNWASRSVEALTRICDSITVNFQVIAVVAGILSCVCPVEYLKFYLGTAGAQKIIAPLQFAVRCQYSVVIVDFWVGLIFG